MGVYQTIQDKIDKALEAANLIHLSRESQYIEASLLGLGCYFAGDKGLNLPTEFDPEYRYLPGAGSGVFAAMLGVTVPEARDFFFHSVNAYCNKNRHVRKPPGPKTGDECEIDGCSVQGQEWDHILPIAWGGTNALWNFQWICKTHNRVKSSSLRSFSYHVIMDEKYRTKFAEWVQGGFRSH